MLKRHNSPFARVAIIFSSHVLTSAAKFSSISENDECVSLASSAAGTRIFQGGDISVTNLCLERNGVTTGEFALLDMSGDERADLTKSKVSGKSNRYSSFRR